MNLAAIRESIDVENWPEAVEKIRLYLIHHESIDSSEELIHCFEEIDFSQVHEYGRDLYSKMWKVALGAGKLSLAKTYLEAHLNNLIELKRIPALRNLKAELEAHRWYKNNEYARAIDFILGKKELEHDEDFSYFELHPESWRNSEYSLSEYVLNADLKEVEEWKNTYLFVLKYQYHRDVFLKLLEKSIEEKNKKSTEVFLNFLKKKKVNVDYYEKLIEKNTKTHDVPVTEASFRYDDLAMLLLSGEKEPTDYEQNKMIASLNYMEKEELLEKAHDMIVAFALLGMNKVVINLCEKTLPHLKTVKERASILFMQAQSLLDNGEFHKTVDIAHDVLANEPLIEDEKIAFSYLLAEGYLHTNRNKLAKDLYKKIKKQNPHYRLVSERLEILEKNK